MLIIHRVYQWVIRLASHKHAKLYLFIVAFCESSIFPIPPDAMLVPMCLAQRKQSYIYFILCLLGSVLGGMAGYLIGYLLFDEIGRAILLLYGHEDGLAALAEFYDQYGIWMILISAITPVPYKVFTIASGALMFNFPLFVLGSIAGRGLRFFLVCFMLHQFGEPIRDFIEKYLGLLSLLAMGLLVGGFLWL